MSHLHWLIASVQHGDANTALANYREFKKKVPEQVNSNSSSLVVQYIAYVIQLGRSLEMGLVRYCLMLVYHS